MRLSIIVAGLGILAATHALAQQQQPALPPGMNQMLQQLNNMSPQEREAMLRTVQEKGAALQACVNENGGMQALQAKGEAMRTHIIELCKDGSRDEAQAYAIQKGKEFTNDPDVKKIQDCSKDVQNAMPFIQSMIDTQIAGHQDKHVCDQQL